MRIKMFFFVSNIHIQLLALCNLLKRLEIYDFIFMEIFFSFYVFQTEFNWMVFIYFSK